MLIRYKNGSDGLDAVARIYSKDEHKINPALVDKDAVKVIERLNEFGFESYLVGGAVRDLLLGRIPKDFDVATAASPRQVHKLFYNSRIIGRRFKIVHISFGQKIIEVSTFRSTKEHEFDSDNEFGTIEEDAARRDFSINSLYYNPTDETLIDFNNSMEDFKNRKLVSLIPLNKTFIEDPVRMVRAIKYSVTTGFSMSFRLRQSIKHYAPELSRISTSRMTEEVNKILASGCSSEIISKLNSFKLLVYILPAISIYADFPQINQSLHELDLEVQAAKSNPQEKRVTKAKMYLALVKPLISKNEEVNSPQEYFQDTFRQIKVLLSPITPPNYEIESACALYLKQIGVKIPKNAMKHKPPEQGEGVQKRKSNSQNSSSKKRKKKKTTEVTKEAQDQA